MQIMKEGNLSVLCRYGDIINCDRTLQMIRGCVTDAADDGWRGGKEDAKKRGV